MIESRGRKMGGRSWELTKIAVAYGGYMICMVRSSFFPRRTGTGADDVPAGCLGRQDSCAFFLFRRPLSLADDRFAQCTLGTSSAGVLKRTATTSPSSVEPASSYSSSLSPSSSRRSASPPPCLRLRDPRAISSSSTARPVRRSSQRSKRSGRRRQSIFASCTTLVRPSLTSNPQQAKLTPQFRNRFRPPPRPLLHLHRHNRLHHPSPERRLPNPLPFRHRHRSPRRRRLSRDPIPRSSPRLPSRRRTTLRLPLRPPIPRRSSPRTHLVRSRLLQER